MESLSLTVSIIQGVHEGLERLLEQNSCLRVVPPQCPPGHLQPHDLQQGPQTQRLRT